MQYRVILIGFSVLHFGKAEVTVPSSVINSTKKNAFKGRRSFCAVSTVLYQYYSTT